jgi:hypothetical protein
MYEIQLFLCAFNLVELGQYYFEYRPEQMVLAGAFFS